MSVDIKDHRRYQESKLKDTDKLGAEPQKALLPQAEVAGSTGNDQLDKMTRVIQSFKERDDKHATEVALKGIGCVQDDMLRLQQMEYFYTKGKVDAQAEILLVPAQIILESKTFTPDAHA